MSGITHLLGVVMGSTCVCTLFSLEFPVCFLVDNKFDQSNAKLGARSHQSRNKGGFPPINQSYQHKNKVHPLSRAVIVFTLDSRLLQFICLRNIHLTQSQITSEY